MVYFHRALGCVLLSAFLGVRAQSTTVTGDTYCNAQLCVAATVNGSTVDYVLQSTGSASLGWMAMGFGTTMAGSPMVIMWPNSDGTITLSQRKASSEVEPKVDSSPPRVASLSSALSSTSGTKPKLAFTIPANSDTKQHIIWAFGTTAPGSSAADATLQQHLVSGASTLDLTKTTSTSTSDTASSPASTASPGSSGSPSSSSPSPGIPLLPYQKLIVAHGILCAVGFLFFLPAGALLARYLRTFTPTWFKGHWIAQFGLAGPIIIAGVALGVQAVEKSSVLHLNDTHKRWGVGIFALYFLQCALGALIHWVKPKDSRRRPPQNYLHAVTGLLIIALALYQVRSGYKTEWPTTTGRGELPGAINTVWYVWVVLLPLLYVIGLAFLPKQHKQEKASRANRISAYGLPQTRYRDEPDKRPLRA